MHTAFMQRETRAQMATSEPHDMREITTFRANCRRIGDGKLQKTVGEMTAITPTPVVIRQDHTAIDQRPRTGDKQEKPRYGLAPVLDDASEDESEAGIESHVLVEYRSKAAVLPIEILGHVFAHLAPADLDSAALVCRHWYRAADDASWRASFARHFAVTKFNRVTPSLKWRTEFMTRLDYLHKWRKGHCTNLSFNAAVWDISNVFSDFEASRILALNLNRGIAVVADPTRGKVANQRVFTDKSLQPSADAISVDGGRHGIVWGLIGGRVMLVLFSHETRLRDYMTLKGFHFDNTTAVWINKLEAPRTTARIPVLSGGSDGHVFLWNVKTGLIEKDLTAIPDVPIVRIKGDSRERFVCLNARGDVFAFDRTKDEELRRIASIPLGGGSVIHFEVDFVSGYAIIAIPSGVYRVFIDGDALPAADPAVPLGAAPTASATASAGVSPALEPVPEHTETDPRAAAQRIPSGMSIEGPVVRFSTAPDPLGKIVAASVDATAFPASRVGTDTPGSNVRYVAAATDRNLVYVWDLEHAPSPEHNNEIPALRVQDSPFEVREEGADPQSTAAAPLPAVTAVALNSLVLLLGSYNGVTVALDLLTGDFLRVVSARFSKRALDFRAAGGPGRLWPVTHLELDPDPASPHGIIVVRSAIQYFDLGAEHNRSTIKKKGVQKRPAAYTGGAVQTGSSSRGQIEQDIEQELRMMDESDDEEGEDDEDLLRVRRERNARQFFGDMTEEEQLRYAMILSRGEENSQGESETEDPEIRRVLELSAAPEPGASAPLPPSSDIDLSRLTEEQQFEYALRLSQQEPQTEEQALEMALKLSEQEPQTEEQALEMALKLSQQQEQEKVARGRAPDPEPAAEDDDDDLDEEMKLALRLSLQES